MATSWLVFGEHGEHGCRHHRPRGPESCEHNSCRHEACNVRHDVVCVSCRGATRPVAADETRSEGSLRSYIQCSHAKIIDVRLPQGREPEPGRYFTAYLAALERELATQSDRHLKGDQRFDHIFPEAHITAGHNS